MNPEERRTLKSLAVVGLAVLFSVMVIMPQASGDILGQGSIKLTQTVTSPPIITHPCNVTYKGSTFQWNYSAVNNTLSSTLRVHVNFNITKNSEYWNVLEMLNPGNITGNITVTIIQWAKMGSQVLVNETYTQNVSVYLSHTWQTSSNPGTRLYNNTAAGPFTLYPASGVSYYIGVIYTIPTYPPSTSNYNSFGEYIDFTFTLHM